MHLFFKSRSLKIATGEQEKLVLSFWIHFVYMLTLNIRVGVNCSGDFPLLIAICLTHLPPLLQGVHKAVKRCKLCFPLVVWLSLKWPWLLFGIYFLSLVLIFFFLVDCFGGFFSCSLSRLLQHIQGPLFSSYLNWALLLGWQSVRLQPSPQAQCLDLS